MAVCLSNEYSDDDWPFLKLLGVRELDFDGFIERLYETAGKRVGFCSKEARWHIHLAQTLLAESKQITKAFDLPIIPLSDGRWVSAKASKGNLFKKNLSMNLDIPPNLGLNVIALDATEDTNRESLYLSLGAYPLNVTMVQDRILDTHSKTPPASLSSALAHVRFLFASKWTNRQKATIHVPTKCGKLAPSFSVYMDIDQPFCATRYFKNTVAHFHFLDPRLLEATSKKDELIRWLIDELGVSIIPRLVSFNTDEGTSNISRDFQHLIDIVPSIDWLLLLRDHWEDYSLSLRRNNADAGRIYKTLGSQQVLCTNGRKHILRETCLPLSQWTEYKDTQLPILDIPGPNNSSWEFLQRIGVITGFDAKFCLRWLESARYNQINTEEVGKLYLELQGVTQDHDLIRKEFQEKALIYVPAAEQKWHTPKECFWGAPKSVRLTPRLNSLYPGCEKLFRQILGIEDAVPEDLLIEARNCHEGETYQLFRDADELIFKSGLTDKARTRPEVRFPIRDFEWSLSFRSAQEMWFIADRDYLYHAFKGCSSLLAFDVQDVLQLQNLVRYFGLEDRLLSKISYSHVYNEGSSSIDRSATRKLQQKVSFLLSLTHKENMPEAQSLRTIEVHKAQKVTMQWAVEHAGAFYGSHPQEANGYLVEEGSKLKVYLERESIRKGYMPFRVSLSLARRCGMEDPECLDTVILILSHPDPSFVQAVLQKRGYALHSMSPAQNLLNEHEQLERPTEAVPDSEVLRLGDDPSPSKKEASPTSSSAECMKKSSVQAPLTSSQSNDPIQPPMKVYTRRSSRKQASKISHHNQRYSIQSRVQRRLNYYIEGHDPFVVDPGIPSCSLRDLYRNAVPQKTDIARVIFVSDLEYIATYKKAIRETETLPARIGTDAHGSLTAFVNIKSEAQTEATFLGELCLKSFERFMGPDPWAQHVKGNLQLFTGDELDRITVSPHFLETHLCPTLPLEHSYSYQPLKSKGSIRLLRLEGDNKDDMTITGGLEEVSLHDCSIEYTGLSYTWGSSLKPFKLRTNLGSIALTVSLYFAIVQMLRDTDGPRVIWVDAVSINQEDESEKAGQIEILDDIFGQAAGILGWVGKESVDSRLAFDTIRYLARRPPEEMSGSDMRVNSDRWAAVNALIARPWFRRTWIVQEVVFARKLTLVCGRDQIQWDDFRHGIKTYIDLAKVSISNLQIPSIRHTENIQSLSSERQRYWNKPPSRPSLMELLDAFQHTECSLLRDKLFALRSLAGEASNNKFRPDYRSSLTDVLHRYAAAFVEQGDALQLLSRAAVSSEPDKDLPSWVPRWTSIPYPRTVTSWKSADVNISGSRAPEAAFNAVEAPFFKDPERYILVIQGHLSEALKFVGVCNSDSENILEYLDEIFKTVESLPRHKQRHADLIWKLAIGNAANLPEVNGVVPNYRKSYEELRKFMKGGTHWGSGSPVSLATEVRREQKRGLWLGGGYNE
ncbi:hypothetical protein N8T08_008380 [Aspergillus melleus]|uniref:Uncharacterized protein n=1 Tax=Aspergillus melleus TaxID=138277 RepID=A0ACC3AVL2_9EURO|nr:hypothetical protein N8T08_008380 [Aspergillus melleus]